MKQNQHAQIDYYLASFDQFEKRLNGERDGRIHLLRKEAIKKFSEVGFPTRKDEEWRFTNIAPLARRFFKLATFETEIEAEKLEIDRFFFRGLKGPRLVFLNGVYSDKFSKVSKLPRGCRVERLASALKTDDELVRNHLTNYFSKNDDGFTALNLAFLQDGLFIHIPEGVHLEEPIQVIFLAAETENVMMMHPRNLVLVDRGSRVSLIESYVSLKNTEYFTNAVTEVVLAEGSVMEHDKFQQESEQAYHISNTHISQAGRSNYVSNSIALGGSIVRNNITAVLESEGSECTLNGLSVATGEQLIDNHTTIDHAKAHCSSYELYKLVLDGRSKGVFNGKIFVRKDAQKTDAKQTNQTLVLSDDATIDTKPQLEIFADDVKCTHGATVGQLDPEQVFYLRARGIPENLAKDMLTLAFASDVVGRVKIDPLREQLEQLVYQKLHQGRIMPAE